MGPGRSSLRPAPGLLLPALSGLLLSASLPPAPVALLAPVALTPLALHLLSLSASPGGARDAALAGAVTGGVHGMLSLHWLPLAAWPILGSTLAVAGGLVVWGAAAAFTAAAAWAAHRGAASGGLPLPLSLGCAWVLLGWIPTVFPVAGFAWLGPEAALVERPVLLGATDLVGGAGVAGVLAFVGGSVAQALRGRRAWAAAAVLAVMLGAGYGWVAQERMTPAEGEVLRLAAFSVEADPALLVDREARLARLPVALSRLTEQLTGQDLAALDLVAWPESPTGVADPPPEMDLALQWARILDTPVLAGVMATDETRRTHRRNRLVRAAPDGGLETVHEKRRLVPMAEWRPGARAGGVTPGPRRPPFSLTPSTEGPVGAGALICFEALFPGEARRLRRGGARILVLSSNEGWLVGWGGGLFDAARRQHRAAAVLRAVEVRVPVIRSAVGGTAGGWDAAGRALPATVLKAPGVGLVAVVEAMPAPTEAPPGSRGGAPATAVLALAALALAGRPRRTNPGTPGGLRG